MGLSPSEFVRSTTTAGLGCSNSVANPHRLHDKPFFYCQRTYALSYLHSKPNDFPHKMPLQTPSLFPEVWRHAILEPVNLGPEARGICVNLVNKGLGISKPHATTKGYDCSCDIWETAKGWGAGSKGPNLKI